MLDAPIVGLFDGVAGTVFAARAFSKAAFAVAKLAFAIKGVTWQANASVASPAVPAEPRLLVETIRVRVQRLRRLCDRQSAEELSAMPPVESLLSKT